MNSLFNFRSTFTRYLVLLLALFFVISSVQSHAEIWSKHKRTLVVVHKSSLKAGKVYFVFTYPEKINVPEPIGFKYKYPVSDGKADNNNYQIIRTRTLGLINAQMNV